MEELEPDILNKDPKETRGGARPGAGRKKGSKTKVMVGATIKDYITPTELRLMVERAKKHAKTDKRVLMYLLENVFGKPNTSKAPPPKPKDEHNMSNFLDGLENKNDRQKTPRQNLAPEPPLLDNEQETEESEVQDESGSAEFSGEPPLEEYNTEEPAAGDNNLWGHWRLRWRFIYQEL